MKNETGTKIIHSLSTSLSIVDRLAHLIKNVFYISNNEFFIFLEKTEKKTIVKKTILENYFRHYISYN